MDGPEDLLTVSRPEIPGDHHAASHGDSHEKAGHEEDQGAGGGDCRQCVCPKKFTDNKGIRRIIQLLEHLT